MSHVSLSDLRALLADNPKAGLKTSLEALPDLLEARPDELRGEAGAAFMAKVFEEAGADGIGADVVELVVGRGAFVPSLRDVVAMWCHDDAQRLRITRRSLELGAKPSDARGQQSALAYLSPNGEAELVGLLVEHADEATLREALLATLASDRPRAAENEVLVLARLSDTGFVGPNGLAPVHLAALFADATRLERLLEKGAALSSPIEAELQVTGDDCSPATGMALLPVLRFAVGSTPLDLVEQTLGLYRTYHSAYGKKGASAVARAARIARLEGVADLLASRKAEHGTPVRSELPAWTGEIEGLLAALAKSFGVAPSRALRAAAAVGYRGIGPWTYFVQSLAVLGSALRSTALAEKSATTWLGAIVAGSAITAKKPKTKGLSKDSQTVVKNGAALAERQDCTLMVWTPKPGIAQFVVVGADRHEVLADDAATFVRAELLRLGVDPSAVEVTASELMRGPSDGPSFHPKRLRAGEHAPSHAAIDRIGGVPIGIDDATWPRHEGKPMHHVLTLDLAKHPTLRVPGKRAVSLFLSSPGRHEAISPNGEHARVLLLDDADLARGEPSWPADMAPESERIPAKELLVDDARAATRRECLRYAHAAWMPTFLQGEEGVWEASPGDFVLQFDAELVPSVSFGDMGIFYVFTKTAWLQCH